MQTLRKFSLFMIVLLALGCEKKKGVEPVNPTPEAAEEQAETEDEPGSVEAKCFEGDPAACDELGH
ncbi:MAG: hypothetical protein AAF500_11145 [Myxococcota bacterium]